VGLSLALLSCAPKTAAPPPLTDYTAAQREIWSQVPSTAKYALAVARFGHLIERARALRTLVSAGPVTRKKLDDLVTRAQTKLGFDPLDPVAWSAHGIAVEAPLAIMGNDVAFVALVPVSDADQARTLLEPLLKTTCRARGRWLACGDEMAQPASVAESLWPEVEKEPLMRSELFFEGRFSPPVSAKDFAGGFFYGPQSVVAALDLGEERLALSLRYNNAQAGTLKQYLTRDAGGKSLLGAAKGALGFARICFSPAALWQLAQRSVPPQSIETASNAMLAATGIDLKADLVDNLTGEIFGALWEPTSMMSTMLLGTRDDTRTADLARRLDGIISGLVGSAEQYGIKTSHATEKSHGRAMYVYKADFTQLVKDSGLKMGFTRLEAHLGAVPGALLISFDRANRERALAAIGQSPREFLDSVDPEVRKALSGEAFLSGWGHGADWSAWYKAPTTKQLLQAYSGFDPDLPAIMTELSSLSELLYDHMLTAAVHDHDITLDWTVRLL
jgi:hypothetical protein